MQNRERQTLEHRLAEAGWGILNGYLLNPKAVLENPKSAERFTHAVQVVARVEPQRLEPLLADMLGSPFAVIANVARQIQDQVLAEGGTPTRVPPTPSLSAPRDVQADSLALGARRIDVTAETADGEFAALCRNASQVAPLVDAVLSANRGASQAAAREVVERVLIARHLPSGPTDVVAQARGDHNHAQPQQQQDSAIRLARFVADLGEHVEVIEQSPYFDGLVEALTDRAAKSPGRARDDAFKALATLGVDVDDIAITLATEIAARPNRPVTKLEELPGITAAVPYLVKRGTEEALVALTGLAETANKHHLADDFLEVVVAEGEGALPAVERIAALSDLEFDAQFHALGLIDQLGGMSSDKTLVA